MWTCCKDFYGVRRSFRVWCSLYLVDMTTVRLAMVPKRSQCLGVWSRVALHTGCYLLRFFIGYWIIWELETYVFWKPKFWMGGSQILLWAKFFVCHMMSATLSCCCRLHAAKGSGEPCKLFVLLVGSSLRSIKPWPLPSTWTLSLHIQHSSYFVSITTNKPYRL